MLILARSFDLIAPVMHDFSYESLLYDVREVGDQHELKVENGKTVFLND